MRQTTIDYVSVLKDVRKKGTIMLKGQMVDMECVDAFEVAYKFLLLF